jgi:mannose/fructose/N-acetylgalactosamine-specific phosphotransferase system component IIC
MKMKNTVISAIIAVTQSKWIRPALMTLAILVAVLGVSGCTKHPH